jgi:hypothetical protein
MKTTIEVGFLWALFIMIIVLLCKGAFQVYTPKPQPDATDENVPYAGEGDERS